MRTSERFRRSLKGGLAALALTAAITSIHSIQAEEFAFALGDAVSDGVPSTGAGRLATSTEEDFYTFTAVAGQLGFFEPISQGPGFAGYLRWQLLRPNGLTLFSSFFVNPIGRVLLPDAGTYRIRVYTSGTDPAWVGPYSFKTQALPPDQTFAFTVGTTVSDGVPAPGAGRLEVGGAEDNFTFTATAGQLAFFEPLSQDAAFGGRLRWQLIKPSGLTAFASFFSNPIGRIPLPEAGLYRIRIYTDATDSDWFGPYSFRVSPIPPDQSFDYTIGTTVSDGVPDTGAGKLEVAGAEDSYVFQATAGTDLFFQSLSQGAGFKNNLRWQLIRPAGGTVFSSFFAGSPGKKTLPDTGQYRIRVFTDGGNPEFFGAYSFLVTNVSEDQTFPYTIGTTVSDGVPAVGAGRLESTGSEDSFTFTATAGQVVFFESLSQDASFKQNLRWSLIKPSGGTVFASFFTNPQGRTVLPEAGEYRIRLYTDSTDPTILGAYSFKTRGDVLDQLFEINVGDLIVNGEPEEGAGNLETPGSTDTYSFTGRANQVVIFESISQAPAFAHNLRWELLKPSAGTVFNSFFDNPQGRVHLPEAGVYKIRLYTSANNPAWIGPYSFRTYSPVYALPDTIATRPGEAVQVGFAKFLFNDTAEDPADELTIAMPAATTGQGGAVTIVGNSIRYTPKAGFAGLDQFKYRLLGAYGGTNETDVKVTVAPEVGTSATHVNFVLTGSGADFCFLGEANKQYGIEGSPDLIQWTAETTLTADATGGFIFHMIAAGDQSHHYFRARRK